MVFDCALSHQLLEVEFSRFIGKDDLGEAAFKSPHSFYYDGAGEVYRKVGEREGRKVSERGFGFS